MWPLGGKLLKPGLGVFYVDSGILGQTDSNNDSSNNNRKPPLLRPVVGSGLGGQRGQWQGGGATVRQQV